MATTNGVVPPTGAFSQPADLLKIYKNFESTKLESDKQLFSTEADHLRQYESQLKEMRALINGYKQKALDDTAKLNREVDTLRNEKDQHERAAQQLKKTISSEQNRIANLRVKYIDMCKQRIAIANTIDTHALGELEIEDRKSEAHDLFKWLIITFYKEPVSKYYWDNFAKQAFKNKGDKGHDFKERLGKISAADLKEEERVSTENIVKNKMKYLGHKDLASVKTEVEKLIKIADLAMAGYNLTKEAAVQEDAISKTKFQIKGKEELASKCTLKVGAIKDRMHISDHYIIVLDEIDNSLSKKQTVYDQVANQGQRILSVLETTKLREPTPIIHYQKPQPKIQKVGTPQVNQNSQKKETTSQPKGETHQGETNQGETQQPPPLYNTEPEKRDVCNCLMF